MIASLQMAGLLVGCLVSGHIADAVGRKLPLFSSLVVMLVFNTVGYFSVSWIMFAVARVGLGKFSINDINTASKVCLCFK